MQEYVRFRSVSKVIGWIHFICAIFGLVGCIILIGLVSYVLSNPNYLENLDPDQRIIFENGIQFGTYGLIYYVFGFIEVCIDIWIAKGLINATDVETSICDALPLAKRWRLWFIFITFVYVGIGFIIKPIYGAVLGAIVAVLIRGLICYLVHRYIKSLEETQPSDFEFIAEKV